MPESSFTQKHGTSFTDVPGKEGYVGGIPELRWGQYEQQQPEEAQQFPMPEPPGGMEGYLTPNYSNRTKFEDFVMRELGANPFELNPQDALEIANENLPDLFHHFFGGRVVWSDRGNLSKAQKDAWDDVVRSYHAWAFEKAKMDKAVLIDKYNFMMNQFDNSAKQYEANVDRIRKQREAFVKEQEKEESAKRAAAAKEAAAKLKAAQPSPVKSEAANTYRKQLGALVDEFNTRKEETGVGTVDPAILDMFNKFAKEHDLVTFKLAPTGQKIEKREKKYFGGKKGWFGLRDILSKDEISQVEEMGLVPDTEEATEGATEKATKPTEHGEIIRRGKTKDGRRVVQYQDGTIDYE